ncbi:proteolipid membrane potential modulator domain-containing protein [Ditylenchus destructor]|nr:proteolipid membrane potential modulator domain-containing protein [Ditylenchus destructor]
MSVSARQIIELGFCILLPPLAVFIHGGCTIHVLISVFFCILGWIPAIAHAVWYCFFHSVPTQQQRVVVSTGPPI